MSSTFVVTGSRVTIYDDPYTMTRKEGTATVVGIHTQSDMESAYVDVLFDGEQGEPYQRWILPQHVMK